MKLIKNILTKIGGVDPVAELHLDFIEEQVRKAEFENELINRKLKKCEEWVNEKERLLKDYPLGTEVIILGKKAVVRSHGQNHIKNTDSHLYFIGHSPTVKFTYLDDNSIYRNMELTLTEIKSLNVSYFNPNLDDENHLNEQE